MSTKSKSNGSMIPSISMVELQILSCECEALYAEGLFGWMADSQIAKIGEDAKRACEYKIGEDLDANNLRRMGIEEKFRAPYKDLSYEDAHDVALNRDLGRSKEYMETYSKENQLWSSKMDDFKFDPVKVKIPDNIKEQIKKPERIIMFRGKPQPIEVYVALGNLVRKGYLIETT